MELVLPVSPDVFHIMFSLALWWNIFRGRYQWNVLVHVYPFCKYETVYLICKEKNCLQCKVPTIVWCIDIYTNKIQGLQFGSNWPLFEYSGMKPHGSKLKTVSTSTGSLQTTVDELVSELFNLLGRGEVPCFNWFSFKIKMPKCFWKVGFLCQSGCVTIHLVKNKQVSLKALDVVVGPNLKVKSQVWQVQTQEIH